MCIQFMKKSVYMKKARVPASIDKEIHLRIKHLIKTHPELEYKKISGFVNQAIEEKLDKIDDELTLKKIRKAGIEQIIKDAKYLRRHTPILKEDIEKASADIMELRDKMMEKFEKRKHTRGVYKSKKK